MKRKAMTLLEAVLAVSIIVAMRGGVYSFYSNTLSTRERVTEFTQRIAAKRITMGRLTAELRAAKVYPFVNTGMKGSGDSLEFITAVVPGPAAWVERSATEDPIPPEHDLRLVGYRLRKVEDEDGLEGVEGLERTCMKVMAPMEAEEGQEIEVAFLTPHVKFLHLRYWDGSGWINSWDGGDLPGAVEIIMGFEPAEPEADPDEYPHETFRRIVYVPSAGRRASGTTVRGLGRGGSR